MRFYDCQQRIFRADAHQKATVEAWDRFTADEPYMAAVEVADDGSGVIDVHLQYDTLPPLFSLEFGEMLYQLRAALDSLVYQAAIYDSGQDPPPQAEALEFPFRATAKKRKDVGQKIAPLSVSRQAIVAGVQPYKAPHVDAAEKYLIDSLVTLNDWARIDRHRRLHLIGSWASEANPALRLPEGVTLSRLTVTHPTGQFLEEQYEIATFKLDGWEPDMNIAANPNLFIDITVNEASPIGTNVTLNEATNRLKRAVEAVWGRFEASYRK